MLVVLQGFLKYVNEVEVGQFYCSTSFTYFGKPCNTITVTPCVYSIS